MKKINSEILKVVNETKSFQVKLKSKVAMKVLFKLLQKMKNRIEQLRHDTSSYFRLFQLTLQRMRAARIRSKLEYKLLVLNLITLVFNAKFLSIIEKAQKKTLRALKCVMLR